MTAARTLIVLVLATLALVAPASAQTEEDFTPVGYEFCGWWDFDDREWTFDDPEPGVWTRLFARKMTCKSARRNYGRLRYTQTPPFRPVKPGYKCATLDDDLEYSDVRCSKKGSARVSFRYQGGA